jgi:hypothetical protein
MLTKTLERAKFEVVGEFKNIQIAIATIIKEDGVEISRKLNRHVVECGDWADAEKYDVTDYAKLEWTDKLITGYQAKLVA